MIRVYYKIKIYTNWYDNDQCQAKWHSSNNGTNQWNTLAKVKSILTRGVRCGYRGRSRVDFKNYEVVKFTETIDLKTETINMDEI